MDPYGQTVISDRDDEGVREKGIIDDRLADVVLPVGSPVEDVHGAIDWGGIVGSDVGDVKRGDMEEAIVTGKTADDDLDGNTWQTQLFIWVGLVLPQVPEGNITVYGWDAALVGWPVKESQFVNNDEQPDTHCHVLVAGFQKYPSQVCWPPEWAYNHAFISASSTHIIIEFIRAHVDWHWSREELYAFANKKQLERYATKP